MTMTDERLGSTTIATSVSGVPAPPPEAPRRSRARSAAFLALVVVAAAATGAVTATTLADEPAAPITIERIVRETTPAAVPAPAPGSFDPAAISAAIVPSVVTVQVGSSAGNGFAQSGSGSGVIFDDAGHIVTNDHVATSGSAIRVVLSNGLVYPAEVVGTDPDTDLAVLQIEANDLSPIAFGSTDALAVGADAVAVGSPLGLDGGPSLTVGVISALGREVQTDAQTILYGMLQTDAPITSGSSGGALVDGGGSLIGITTAVGVSNIGVEGIGFATPIEVVTRVVGEIITDGRATHAVLGINGATAYQGTADGGLEPVGVEVEAVQPNSGAASSGLTSGTVITAVAGIPVRTMDELITVLRAHAAGEAVTVELTDGSTTLVILGDR